MGVLAGVREVGAGCEVSEFVLRLFWYRCSLLFYVTDSAIDLVVNKVGAAVVAVAAAGYRSRTEAGVVTDPDPSDAPADTDATAADPE